MPTSYLNEIAQKILDKNCVFFIGSGLSAIGRIYKSNSELNGALIDEFKDDPRCIDARKSLEELLNHKSDYNMPVMVDRIVDLCKSESLSEQACFKKVKAVIASNLKNDEPQVNLAHQLLADLNIGTIYTTNYDISIEEAYKRIGLAANVYNIREEIDPAPSINLDGLPDVIKLYGTAGNDGIIVSEKKFFELYGSVKFEQVFHRLLDQKTIVFIGYSLTDSVFEYFFNRLSRVYNQRHYAITIGNLNDKFKNITKIHIDALDFLLQLRFTLISAMFNHIPDWITQRKEIEIKSINLLAQHARDFEDVNSFLKDINDNANAYSKAIGEGNPNQLPSLDLHFHSSINRVNDEAEFRKVYMRMQCFIKSTHNSSTDEEHKAINECLNTRNFTGARENMIKHLDNVKSESIFWNTYLSRFISILDNFSFQDRLIKWFNEDSELIDIYTFEKNETLLLLGPGGIGKSTMIQRYILRAIAFGKIPILLDLKKDHFKELLFDMDYGDIYGFIEDYLNCLDKIAAPKEGYDWNKYEWRVYFRRILDKGGLTVLIDGLDLISEKDYSKGCEQINRIVILLRSVSKLNFVFITSRKEVYLERQQTHLTNIKNDCQLCLSYLNDIQIKDYIELQQNLKPEISSGLAAIIDTVHHYYPDEITFMLLDLLTNRVKGEWDESFNICTIYDEYLFRQNVRFPKLEFSTLDELKGHSGRFINGLINNTNIPESTGQERMFSHPSFTDFIMAKVIAQSLDAIEYAGSLIDRPEYWGVLIFTSGLLPYPGTNDKIIELLIKKSGETLFDNTQNLLIRYIRNSRHQPARAAILTLFVNINKAYDAYGQIPTQEVAKEIQYIGKYGAEALTEFLFVDYEERQWFNNAEEPFEIFVKHKSKTMARSRPIGMLRRSAIDCIGKINNPGSNKLVAENLPVYYNQVKQAKLSGDIKLRDEWEHNLWHLCIALNTCSKADDINGIVKNFYNEEAGKLDVISKLELLYYHYNITADNSHEVKRGILSEIKQLLPALRESLYDEFIWRRAHACGVISSLKRVDDSVFSSTLNELFLNPLIKIVKGEEKETMVRYYGAIALGEFEHDAVLEALSYTIEKLIPQKTQDLEQLTGWISFAATNSILEIKKKGVARNIRFHDTHDIASVIERQIESFCKFFDLDVDISKNKIHYLSVANCIRLLGYIGSTRHIKILEDFERKVLREGDISVIQLGSLRFLINSAISRLKLIR